MTHAQIRHFKYKEWTCTCCDPRLTELTVAPKAASLAAANDIIRTTSFLRSGCTESLSTATHSLRFCTGRKEQLNKLVGLKPRNLWWFNLRMWKHHTGIRFPFHPVSSMMEAVCFPTGKDLPWARIAFLMLKMHSPALAPSKSLEPHANVSLQRSLALAVGAVRSGHFSYTGTFWLSGASLPKPGLQMSMQIPLPPGESPASIIFLQLCFVAQRWHTQLQTWNLLLSK